MQKNCISILMAVLLCFSAVSLVAPKVNYEQADGYLNNSEAYLNIYQDILDNNAMMLDVNTNETVYLCDYLMNAGLSKYRYSIIDLDGDANPEMIISLSKGTNEYYGSLILHNDQDVVYAYELAYRTFFELKYDGTFMYSSGVSNYGIGKIDFIDAAYKIISIAYSETADDDQNISYYIDDNIVSKETFEAYVEEQTNKDDASWQEFTLDNSSQS